MTNKEIKSIVVCGKCKGAGEVVVEYWIQNKDTHVAICDTCKGTGRLMRTVKIDYTPMDVSIGDFERICK